MLSRHDIISTLVSALEPHPAVLAMWEAGSAAFGRLDEYSDIDLSIDIEKAALPAVIELFEETLAGLSPIVDRYELPQPAWHGHDQRFYRLRDTDPFLMLDVVFIDHENPQKFLETELHGHPLVLFDKADVVTPPPFDRSGNEEKIKARLANLQGFFRLLNNLPQKELLRNRPLDAMNFYQGLLLRPLVELLRIKYDPDRYTFGMRYLEIDLPAEETARLQPLVFIHNPDDLGLKIPLAIDWIESLMADLSQTYLEE